MKHDPYAPLRPTMTETPQHWRSVEHKALTPEVVAELDVEMPTGTVADDDEVARRDFLKIGGAGMALAGMTGCFRRPEEEILPYTHQPETLIPGVAQYYATSMARSEGAVGLLVESHEGRPTKIEGNPLHPASLGAADIWAQAEVLRLYDPDRARVPLKAGAKATWKDWDEFAATFVAGASASAGKGIAILTEDDESPTFARLLKGLTAKWSAAKAYRWDPLAADNAQQGAELAFGAGARVRYDLEKAKVVYAVDSNFLVEGPEHLRLARQYSRARRPANAEDAAKMNRLYVSEGAFTSTGANADHRYRLSSAQQPALLAAVAKALASKGVAVSGFDASVEAPAGSEKFVNALAADLAEHKGAAAILVGEKQPAAVHALALAINQALGAVGATVLVSKAAGAAPRVSVKASLTELARSLGAGEVETLIVFDANPLYTAPGALKFAEAMAKAKTVIHVGVLPEETGAKAGWHLPSAHFLEAWADTRAWDGTVALVQPLILPLFGARSSTSIVAQLGGATETNDKKLVEETWVGAGKALGNAKAWRKALHDGVIAGTTATAAAVGPADAAAISAAFKTLAAAAPSKDALELVALTGNNLDGRLANLTWNQELPDGMTKLCWDNALLISPALAKELGVSSTVAGPGYRSDVVEVTANGAKITAPTFILPGLAQYTVAMVRGYGRSFGGVATGVGVDVTPLLSDGVVVAGVKVAKTGAIQQLCSTQDHFSVPGNPYKEMTFVQMAGATGAERVLAGLGERPLFRSATVAELRGKEGAEVLRKGDIPEDLVQLRTPSSRPVAALQPVNDIVYESQQWGMVIDLSACIGCNACAVACVSENNIPAVGRDQVLLGRELHWMRIDRYYKGDIDNPEAMHQPVNCQHCENAPCEPVCPVGATVHDEEGINSMAYNRCIGTRYCANNCPYKVRRFNYLDYTNTGLFQRDEAKDARNKLTNFQRNPNVTVRYRGVMEKCTYCTQRIEAAKIAAKRKGQDRKGLPDGAVTPACAQTCPTEAITFGNINAKDSKVSQLKLSERNYEMLQELNVRPRTTYLARIKNTNEELA